MLISKKPLKTLITAILLIFPLLNFANSTNTSTTEVANDEKTNLKTEIKEFINHHLLDSHSFTLLSDKEKGISYGFSLPVILWDGGFQIFSSSEFSTENGLAQHNGNFYKLHHEKIYKTDATGALIEEHGHPTNLRPLDLSMTKSVIGLLLVAILLLSIFISLARSYSKNKDIAKGAGRFFEPIIIFVRDEIAIPNIGEKNYKKYMSYLLTVFFFILFLNILGLMPFGFNITGNISITVSLALLTYLITTITANKNYWAHLLWMPGVPFLLRPFLALIELFGTIIKPFSLMIRLYANMFAGHVVLMSIIALMFIFKNWIGSSLSLVLAFVLSILEVLVAVLQAYIFTVLSALYFGAGNEEAHHEEAHNH